MIKAIIEWLLKNFANIFSVLGFVLTIYFGVFYVPIWLKESQNERLKNAQNEILQSVKELVFSDSSFAVHELNSLVNAKEITLNEKFSLSLSDILSEAEESFMEDRYLPLTKRRDLIQEIETIKKQLPKENIIATDKQKAENKDISRSTLLSIISSISAVIIGVISAFTRYQTDKDKEEEIKNEIQEIPTRELSKYAYEFEREIESVLQSRKDIILSTKDQNRGIDFEFSYHDKRYFVEAKFLTRSKIGLNTIHQLTYFLRDKSGEAWLIYNTNLTQLVAKEIDKYNQNNRDVKIKAIRVTSGKEFADKLDELLNK
jgi:hypothetical protein